MALSRNRFRPVKTTNELALLRSDRYALDADSVIVATVDGPEPHIDLGPEFTFVPDFERRFPAGVPSLRECTSLRVRGDVTFGAEVRCVGSVDLQVDRPTTIEAGARLGTVGGSER